MNSVPRQSMVIYGLHCTCHPERGNWYIGQTSKGAQKRFFKHLYTAKRNLGLLRESEKDRWINSHPASNLKYKEICFCSDPDCLERCEVEQIAAHRLLGQAEFNISPGGRHGSGYSSAMKGRAMSQEQKDKISASNTGVSRGWGNTNSVGNIGLRGTTHPLSKLDENKVHEIRNLLRQGLSPYKISKIYGVSPALIRGIKSGEKWGWLTSQ